MMVQPISFKNISGWVENKKTPVVHCVFFQNIFGWVETTSWNFCCFSLGIANLPANLKPFAKIA